MAFDPLSPAAGPLRADRRRGRPLRRRPTRASAQGLSEEALEAAHASAPAAAGAAYLSDPRALAARLGGTGPSAVSSLPIGVPPAEPLGPARPAAGSAPGPLSPAARVARMRTQGRSRGRGRGR